MAEAAQIGDQVITDGYALYNGDSCEVLPTLPDGCVDLSIYSIPFLDLYNYSSADADLSNCKDAAQFYEHYEFILREKTRLTPPGRLSVVHCTDIKAGKGAQAGILDFPGDLIRLHEKHGWWYHSRNIIWKEPLRVAMRTLVLGLRHKQIVKDANLCRVALPDYLLVFRKKGINKRPIAHPLGMLDYYGARRPPSELLKFRSHKDPKTNKLAHWIWQQYASSMWDDIRIENVLPYKPARESPEEKHVCPLQLDVIFRAIQLWSNPGETVLTPFMGVGSEMYGARCLYRKGIGVELKPSYFRQSVKNVEGVADSFALEADRLNYDDSSLTPDELTEALEWEGWLTPAASRDLEEEVDRLKGLAGE